MLAGIDVGGTYTDGVLLSTQGEVLAFAKVPTQPGAILDSLLCCLDQLIVRTGGKGISRVGISTTLLTNAILQANLAKTALIVVPGPGLRQGLYPFGITPLVLSGGIDFRGREVIPLNVPEIRDTCKNLTAQGYVGAAIAGKFAQRNNIHELALETQLHENCPGLSVKLSHRVRGGLNFPRRANTVYLAAATDKLYRDFVEMVQQALWQRGIKAPFYILKADGGTVPGGVHFENPVDCIYSGPAASLLGVTALMAAPETTVVMDIGGTTTDLGLVLGREPLTASHGAQIGSFKTLVRSFAVNSLPIGGDTLVKVVGGKIKLTTERLGAAYCIGGPGPTPTDALRYLGHMDYGCGEKAATAMASLANQANCSPVDAANEIVEQAVENICRGVKTMIAQWENEPAYRVWEVLNPHRITSFSVTGVGGAAKGLVPLVAERLNTTWHLPKFALVANAIGAALARPTFSLSLRVDTAQGVYSIPQAGIQKRWTFGPGILEKARELLQQHFGAHAGYLGVPAQDMEIVREESFNLVRGYKTEGKIVELEMSLKAAVLFGLREERQDE
ncbi:MAG TPA: hydantoinase/oxoprolinase family protein [Verrucomicrobiae bacterium]|nr:hydantoinase/oxoprolinase family protein [Verrucomicrobiae bacterium]